MKYFFHFVGGTHSIIKKGIPKTSRRSAEELVKWFQSGLAEATERVAGCGYRTTSLEANCE